MPGSGELVPLDLGKNQVKKIPQNVGSPFRMVHQQVYGNKNHLTEKNQWTYIPEWVLSLSETKEIFLIDTWFGSIFIISIGPKPLVPKIWLSTPVWQCFHSLRGMNVQVDIKGQSNIQEDFTYQNYKKDVHAFNMITYIERQEEIEVAESK